MDHPITSSSVADPSFGVCAPESPSEWRDPVAYGLCHDAREDHVMQRSIIVQKLNIGYIVMMLGKIMSCEGVLQYKN
jgi:hypothetical protein